jgi:hypothetical protein
MAWFREVRPNLGERLTIRLADIFGIQARGSQPTMEPRKLPAWYTRIEVVLVMEIEIAAAKQNALDPCGVDGSSRWSLPFEVIADFIVE